MATLRGAAPAGRAVRRLVADTDPLVRAAGLAALGELGCGQDDYRAVKRAAAGAGMAGARRHGTRAGRVGGPAARDALGIALQDSDADVRAPARRALEHGGVVGKR